MPRFYFHTEDGVCFPDEVGHDLTDLAVAKEVELNILSEILRNEPKVFWPRQQFKLYVSRTRDPRDADYTFTLGGEAESA